MPAKSNLGAKVFLGGIAAILLGMGGFVAYQELLGDDAARERQRQPTPVTLAEVVETEFSQIIEAVGTARANESVEITARVTESVADVRFDSGDRVQKGEVLVVLTDTEEAAELTEAEAAVREAERDYKRIDDLVEQNAASQARLDTELASLERARARVQAIKARLDDRLITAPFEGVVGLRNISPGALVRPGDVVATLDDVSVIKLDFDVPETFLAAVAEGQSITALSPAFRRETFRGQVASVDSRIDPDTRMVTVRALIDNADLRLRPGMLMTVELVRNRRISPTVPEAGLQMTQTSAYVYRVVENPNGEGMIAERQVIETGARAPGRVEVLSGLELGAEVVVEGIHRIRSGAPVEVVGRSENALESVTKASAAAGNGSDTGTAPSL